MKQSAGLNPRAIGQGVQKCETVEALGHKSFSLHGIWGALPHKSMKYDFDPLNNKGATWTFWRNTTVQSTLPGALEDA